MKHKILIKILQFVFGHLPHQHPKKEANSVNNTPNTEEFERCVMCGKLTSIPVSTPIDFRDFYEVGCGQLCSSCYMKLSKQASEETTLSDARILLAVEQSRKENDK